MTRVWTCTICGRAVSDGEAFCKLCLKVETKESIIDDWYVH